METAEMTRFVLTPLAVLIMAIFGCANGPGKLDPNRPEHHTAEGFRNLYVEPKIGRASCRERVCNRV